MHSEEKNPIEVQIENWVLAYVAHPDVKLHGRCSKLVLRHVNVERKPQGDVKAFTVKLEEGAEDEIDPLLHQIADAAQRDCDDINGGLQSYGLYAYYTQDQNYVPRKYFRVNPSDVEIERDLTPSEPPTEKGLVSQSMRHLEAIMRTTTIANAESMRMMVTELKRTSEINQKFAEQHVDFLVLMQDMLDRSHSRRLQERREEASVAMHESALSKLEAIAPVIVNRLAGKQILPEEDPALMLMGSLLETMTPEQQQTFLTTLTDGQRIVYAEVIDHYNRKKSNWLKKQNQQVSSSQATPSNDPQPLPSALTLQERIALAPKTSSDPQIQKLEETARAFSSRFSDLMRTAPEGDKQR